MKHLNQIQKLAILHCVYQTIASADGEIKEERDDTAIEFAMSELGLTAGYHWSSALQLHYNDCFIHISMMEKEDKESFRVLLLKITEMGGNQLYRTNCANHILGLCGV